MTAVRYLGPAETLNGKEVPKDGLSVNLADAAIKEMIKSGHRFADADVAAEAKPTPQEVDAAAVEGGKKR